MSSDHRLITLSFGKSGSIGSTYIAEWPAEAVRQESHRAEEAVGLTEGAWREAMTQWEQIVGRGKRNQYTHQREKPGDGSRDRKAINHEHGEVTKAGSNGAHLSGNNGMSGKTTNIFYSSTTTGLQGEVQLLSPWLCLQAGGMPICMGHRPGY